MQRRTRLSAGRIGWAMAFGLGTVALPLSSRADAPGSPSQEPKTIEVQAQQIKVVDRNGEKIQDVLIQVGEGGVPAGAPTIRPFDGNIQVRAVAVDPNNQAGGADRVFVFANPVDAKELTLVSGVQKLSEYWLGLECIPVSDAMRSHLAIEANQGLVVAQVVDDSPAAKAGFRQHDILVKAADKPLSSVADLMTVLDEVKENELNVAIIRGGKPETIKAHPAKRPPQDFLVTQAPSINADIGARIGQFFEHHAPGPHGPLRLNIVGPGAFVHQGRVSIPENMSVQIRKEGNKPAQIEVRQGDEHWSISENELDKLPPNAREAVNSMLHGVQPHALRLEGRIMNRLESPSITIESPNNAITVPHVEGGEIRVQPPTPGLPAVPHFATPPMGPWGPNRRPMEEIHKQLNDLQQQIKQLHEEIKQMRSSPSAK